MSIVTAWQHTAAHGQGWYWLAIHAKYGDLYQICALAAAFREVHGAGHPIRLVVSKAGYLPVADLFREEFAEIIVEPNFPNIANAWWELYELTQLPAFGLNAPIILQPHALERTFYLLGFCDLNGTPWTQVYKSILRLPGHVEPALPRRRPEVVEAAERFCEAEGIVAGRSVLLFPYAQSFPVEANAHFTALAEALQADGYEVLTSIGPNETPIPGTRGLFIPFGILIDVANYAGWAVVIRSGIADILAAADCRKTIIYRHPHDLRVWSLRALRLCCDADEISFDFPSQSPNAFVEIVRSGAGLTQLIAQPGGLSAVVQQALEEAGRDVGAIAFPRLQRDPERLDAALARIERVMEEGGTITLRDVPPRTHPYLAERVDAALARLAPLIERGAARCYAARDQDVADFLEELSGRELVNGLYDAARGTHTLLFSPRPLEAVLPRVIAQFVLPLERVPVGETIPLSSTLIDADDLPATMTRPYSVRGYQLVSGWTIPEQWGAWSMGLRSTLKFQFENPDEREALIVLDCHAYVTESFPTLECHIWLDGELVETVHHQHGGPPVMSVIPLPAQPGRSVQSHMLMFTFPAVRTPMEQGHAGDARPLGIGFRTARVELK